MSYERIRRRGLEKVSCEIMLMSLGRNIRKFFTLLDNNSDAKSLYWEKNNNLKTEKFPFPKQKKYKKETK